MLALCSDHMTTIFFKQTSKYHLLAISGEHDPSVEPVWTRSKKASSPEKKASSPEKKAPSPEKKVAASDNKREDKKVSQLIICKTCVAGLLMTTCGFPFSGPESCREETTPCLYLLFQRWRRQEVATPDPPEKVIASPPAHPQEVTIWWCNWDDSDGSSSSWN